VPRTTRRRFVAASLALGATLVTPRSRARAQRLDVVFGHGVASGDPDATSVVLWTRVSGGSGEDVEVRCQLALDAELRQTIFETTTTACAARDYTAKVIATGLAPGTTYYYRFEACDAISPIGRTRTLPIGDVPRVRLAVASCSSYASGNFHAYRHISRRDIDAVLHLGDYIYEYGDAGVGNTRQLDPPHETITLEDYRRRYALHRRDPDLKAAHAAHPFITIWDDHEIANDAYRLGAENHTPDEGAWMARRLAATRAYFEWMPVREAVPGALSRAFAFGTLASLFVLDTRLEGRDRQARWHLDYAALDDPHRDLLGHAQERWLLDAIAASRSAYTLLASQVMLAPLRRPPSTPMERPSPYRIDTWDGYPVARRRLLEALEARGVRDLVVLAGDIHSSWASELAIDPFDPSRYDPVTGRGAIGVEFVTPGITSPSVVPRDALAGLLATNRHVQWAELTRCGYYVLELAAGGATASYTLFDDITQSETRVETAATFRVARGTSHLESVRTSI
jgi:alkaline phosphatase D